MSETKESPARRGFLIIDVETLPLRRGSELIAPCAILDFGMLHLDSEGKEIQRANFVVQEVHPHRQAWHYAEEKGEFYDNPLTCPPIRPYRYVAAVARRMMREARVWSAHNAPFEISALRDMGRLTGCWIKRAPLLLDTQRAAAELCGLQYARWCDRHNKLTPKRRWPSMSVESLSCYLRDDPGYREAHTALSDCLDQAMILRWILRRKQRKPYNQTGSYHAQSSLHRLLYGPEQGETVKDPRHDT